MTAGASTLQNGSHGAVIADFFLGRSRILRCRLDGQSTGKKLGEASSKAKSKNNRQPDSHEDHTE
jgi:hypothetical protein